MIRIENVSKIFRLPHEKSTTIFEQIISFFYTNLKYERFHALRNINLTVNNGEFIGIVGNNGSGKSTLLKIITKILVPTSGKIQSEGRIAAFIELGVGFQNELTARENVFLYGAIMGLSRKDIERKYDNIVDFAGVRKFMDTKMKNFSSGMRVRLAFSTAIQTNPDVLVLDEIMAVGDQDFQKKCYDVFKEFGKSGKTIILASHDLDLIRACDKTLYLNNGKQIMFDKTDIVLKRYLKDTEMVTH